MTETEAHGAGGVGLWERDCLADDPFEGDYGGSGGSDGVLSDKMVTARKGGECHHCAGQAEPDTRNRVRVEVYDGEFMRFRWCEPCCRAMAEYVQNGGDSETLHKRIALGQERRAARLTQGASHAR